MVFNNKNRNMMEMTKEFLEVSSQIHIGLKFRMFFLSLSYLLTKNTKTQSFINPRFVPTEELPGKNSPTEQPSKSKKCWEGNRRSFP